MAPMSAPALSLPISPTDALRRIILPALKLLPTTMTDTRALVMILAIFMQESALAHRWQVIDRARPNAKGPARGLAQFERGTRESRGGVWGVFLHTASRYWLAQVCSAFGVAFQPDAIWRALESNDGLSACLARLLLFTDPKPLPEPGDEDAAWSCYLRTWRPGAYTRGTAQQRAALRAKWASNYATALATVRAPRV